MKKAIPVMGMAWDYTGVARSHSGPVLTPPKQPLQLDVSGTGLAPVRTSIIAHMYDTNKICRTPTSGTNSRFATGRAVHEG